MSYFRKISPTEATYLAKDKISNGQYVNQFFIETKQNFDHNKNLPTISGEIAKEGKVLWMKS